MKGKNFWSLAAIAIIAISFFGCDSYTDSGKGFKYKYLAKGEGEKVDWEEWLMLDFYYYTGADSLFMSSKAGGRPAIFKWDTLSYKKWGDFQKSIENYVPGDSVEYVTTAGWFYNDVQGRLPYFLKEDEEMIIRLKVVDKFADREAINAYFDKLKEKRNLEEDAMIQQYLADNNIDAQKTESGMYYLVEEQGSDDMPAIGDSVTVHYRGTLLDGTPFDASYDRNEPFKFVIGKRMVIAGWDEGLQLFGIGGKGRLIIPSRMAYGERARGNVIKANSILIFDIELLDVKRSS